MLRCHRGPDGINAFKRHYPSRPIGQITHLRDSCKMTHLLFICHGHLFHGGDGNTDQVGILATFIHLFISHVPRKSLLIISRVPGISRGYWSKVEALWWSAVQLWDDELAVDFRLLLFLLYRVGREFPLLSVPGRHTMTMWYCGSHVCYATLARVQ